MQAARTIQTAFRFRLETVRSLQNKARLEGKSVNRYVEDLIEADLKNGGLDYLKENLKGVSFPDHISEDLKQLSSSTISFTEKELEEDDKLKYILEK